MLNLSIKKKYNLIFFLKKQSESHMALSQKVQDHI